MGKDSLDDIIQRYVMECIALLPEATRAYIESLEQENSALKQENQNLKDQLAKVLKLPLPGYIVAPSVISSSMCYVGNGGSGIVGGGGGGAYSVSCFSKAVEEIQDRRQSAIYEPIRKGR